MSLKGLSNRNQKRKGTNKIISIITCNQIRNKFLKSIGIFSAPLKKNEKEAKLLSEHMLEQNATI